jgi:hypothetical protein
LVGGEAVVSAHERAVIQEQNLLAQEEAALGLLRLALDDHPGLIVIDTDASAARLASQRAILGNDRVNVGSVMEVLQQQTSRQALEEAQRTFMAALEPCSAAGQRCIEAIHVIQDEIASGAVTIATQDGLREAMVGAEHAHAALEAAVTAFRQLSRGPHQASQSASDALIDQGTALCHNLVAILQRTHQILATLDSTR